MQFRHMALQNPQLHISLGWVSPVVIANVRHSCCWGQGVGGTLASDVLPVIYCYDLLVLVTASV